MAIRPSRQVKLRLGIYFLVFFFHYHFVLHFPVYSMKGRMYSVEVNTDVAGSLLGKSAVLQKSYLLGKSPILQK